LKAGQEAIPSEAIPGQPFVLQDREELTVSSLKEQFPDYRCTTKAIKMEQSTY
jgi:hypothetical protein